MKFLIIDDNSDDRLLIARTIYAGFPGSTCIEIGDPETCAAALEQGGFDIVLTDYQLGWTTGLAILKRIKERFPMVPVIMVTATGSEEIAVGGMMSGLSDYVLKSPRHLARLPAAVRVALEQIRQRRATEEAIASYIALFAGVPVGLYHATADGTILEANPALAEMLGYPDIAALRTIRRGDLNADAARLQEWQALMDREGVVQGFEERLRRRDGSFVWASENARAVRDADGRLVYEGALEDITQRKHAEAALRSSEEKYRLFFEEDLSADYISRPDGTITSCNPAFARIFGFAGVEEALAANAASLYPRPAARRRFLDRLLRKRQIVQSEVQYVRKDGRRIWTIENAVGRFDENANLVEIWCYLFDNTERRLLEEQLLQAQKMESLGHLASGIAHDFNNVLGGILGHAELALLHLDQNHPLHAAMQRIRELSERAARITRQLLAFSRRQILEPCDLNLNTLVSDLVKLLGRTLGEHVEIAFRPDPGLKTIHADPTQIEQILLNLCVNARDAMPDGGQLAIETRNVRLDERSPRSDPGIERGDYVLLSVADTGAGMTDEVRARMFEPFFTTKEPGKGTGLGLSMVHGVVGQHRGFIDVDSEPGRGTTFRIHLPAVERPAMLPKARSAVSVRGGDETVLVVEDEAGLREVMGAILENYGYTVLTANDGQEGLARFRQDAASIALVISDVVMPGMSGKSLHEAICRIRPETRFLFVSGYAVEAVHQNFILTEGFHFLQKPFSPAELGGRVREILDACRQVAAAVQAMPVSG